MAKPLKLAYYLSRFPKLSETFILRELYTLREMGYDVQIFSILPPKPTHTMHKQVQDLLKYTHYSAFFSWQVLTAQLHFLFTRPRRYFRALGRVIWQTLPEPATCLMALLLFPKSVYFARQLENMGVNHIHAHFVWLTGIAAQVASDLLGIPFSLHAHAWDIFRRNKKCVSRQIELASCIITVSKYHLEFLQSISNPRKPPNIEIVHYGIDPDEFTPAPHSQDRDVIEIISVGRLVEKKGFIYLVEACAALAKRGNSFHCNFVGDGQSEPLQSRIDDLGLSGYVSLLGAKSIEDIQELYRNSDIFALPCIIAKSGDRDGMPNVLIEAMAMEIPVITTSVTGNPELIHNGINGLLVHEGDALSLADGIERLIADSSLRRSIGVQGRQTIIRDYDIHSTVLQLISIFTKILETNPGDQNQARLA